MTDDSQTNQKSRGVGSHLLRGLLLVVVVAIAAVWTYTGTTVKQTYLDRLYSDYTVTREAERHPIIARLVASETAVQAAEEFTADYKSLQESNILTAPIYVLQVHRSHRRLDVALNGPRQDAPASTNTPTATAVTGAAVREVTRGGAAERAGLQVGDVITAVNGVRVTNHGEWYAELRSASWGHMQPVQTRLTVNRDGRQLVINAQTPQRGYEVQK